MNKTYTESFQVRATDCDFERRMRLDALFIAMQEGGEHHALSLGAGYDQMMARGLFFALARIHVSTFRAPRQNETVVHTTWPGEMNRFFCPRYHVFTLQDGTPLAAAGAHSLSSRMMASLSSTCFLYCISWSSVAQKSIAIVRI